jgi:hypothetical protein
MLCRGAMTFCQIADFFSASAADAFRRSSQKPTSEFPPISRCQSYKTFSGRYLRMCAISLSVCP